MELRRSVDFAGWIARTAKCNVREVIDKVTIGDLADAVQWCQLCVLSWRATCCQVNVFGVDMYLLKHPSVYILGLLRILFETDTLRILGVPMTIKRRRMWWKDGGPRLNKLLEESLSR